MCNQQNYCQLVSNMTHMAMHFACTTSTTHQQQVYQTYEVYFTRSSRCIKSTILRVLYVKCEYLSNQHHLLLLQLYSSLGFKDFLYTILHDCIYNRVALENI
jgi:hypothetical protein